MEQIKRALCNIHKLFEDLLLVDALGTPAKKRIKKMMEIVEATGQHIIEMEYPARLTTFKGQNGNFRT